METFTPEMKNLLLQRMEKRYEQGRMAGVFTLDRSVDQCRHFTPQEIIEEARRGTPAGEEFLMAEKKLMEEIKRRM